jgi:hypothetical protein
LRPAENRAVLGCLPATAVPESRNPPNLPNPNDVSPTTSHDLRCPQCSAHTSPGADWCTLCFADLRPKVLQEESAAPPAVEAVPEAEPAVEPATRGNGKHARAATTYDDAAVTAAAPLDPATTYDDAAVTAVSRRDPAETAKINARADEMLAMLKADIGTPLGPMADRLATTHSRIGAGFIGLVGVTLLGWLVMTVLGHLI